MKLVVIHREPIVERVPNLKALLLFASDEFDEVLLITSSSEKFPQPVLMKKNIVVKSTAERSSRFGAPTLMKIMFMLMGSFFRSSFKREEVRYIFAGRGALVSAGLLSLFGFRRFIAFVVEYPSIDKIGLGVGSITDRLEFRGIEFARFFVTHDDWHGKLIGGCFSEKANLKYMPLPNSTLNGCSVSGYSSFLHDRLGLDNKVRIILHSGGFGKWFSSSELAAQSANLSEDFRLVFHCSHDISNSDYYINYVSSKSSLDKTVFSNDPVSDSELDELVSSAYIGVAWYDVNVLGFRAEGMGLAAGKIGHYLKCGVPIIATRLPSLSYIEDFECGVLIEDLSGLAGAVARISSHYARYSQNAKSCHEEMWRPTRYLTNLVKNIKR